MFSPSGDTIGLIFCFFRHESGKMREFVSDGLSCDHKFTRSTSSFSFSQNYVIKTSLISNPQENKALLPSVCLFNLVVGWIEADSVVS